MIIKHKYRRGGSSYHKRTKYRFGGSSIFSNLLGRNVIQNNVRNLINDVVKPKIKQKLADAVVNSSANAIKVATQKGLEKTKGIFKTAIQSGFDKKKNRQAIKEAIDKLVSGNGIVFD